MAIKRFRISDLRPHRLQGEIYGELPPHEFAELKADVARRGVRSPIEVTPSGDILDGHQRVRACQELGIEEIDAVICHDESQEAIDESFILGNLTRRHLGPVAKAKAIQILLEIERRRTATGQVTDHDGDLRDRIAKRLGDKMSGRTVDRILQVARLPPAICQAVEANDLPMTTALKVEKLSLAIQETIAARIRSGAPARHVVAEFLPVKHSAPMDTPAGQYKMLINFLIQNISGLHAASDHIAGAAGNHDQTASVLKATAAFCKTMQVRERSARRESISKTRKKITESLPDTMSTR